jgi:hypothetical protein
MSEACKPDETGSYAAGSGAESRRFLVCAGWEHVGSDFGIGPLSRAEPYGDCLTYPRGHHELWEEWRRMLASDLIGNGLPVSIIGHEYEEFPRGRLVYQRPAKRFVIYADRKLFDAAIIARIVEQFALAHEIREVRSDDHYRT